MESAIHSRYGDTDMSANPIDIRFSLDNYMATLNIMTRCPVCAAKGEPSTVKYDVIGGNSAWTETSTCVAIPCVCQDCDAGMTILVRLP